MSISFRGREMDESEQGRVVGGILAAQGHDPTRLVQILHHCQEAVGWLPPAVRAAVAAGLRLPLAQVEGVAGFYAFFHLQPVGRYRILFSDNITDRM